MPLNLEMRHSASVHMIKLKSPKKSWLGRTVLAFRTLPKQSVQSSLHDLHLTVKMPLNLGADKFALVFYCAIESSVLFNFLCV